LGLPSESWIGASAEIVAAPLGSSPNGFRIVTRGVISNISSSPGLLLTDARCAEGSAGAALVLKDRDCVVGIMAPRLRSTTGENIGLSLAVDFSQVLDALLDSSCAALRDEERAFLESARRPATVSCHRFSELTQQVRKGVALLWLETTGSWASAIVASKSGHLLTCAHLLTGTSWMEEPAEEKSSSVQKSPSQRSRRSPPKSCRGRGIVEGPDGFFKEVVFEADVLHVCPGFLDVAVLLARQSSGEKFSFSPSIWQRFASGEPLAGTEVWAVGYGLFGPGSPWQGPTFTRGHVAKVARGRPGSRTAVLQSSAAVHRGCSGGALVKASTGELLGMVTTNVKQQDGSVMPHVNFSLPAHLLTPLRRFIAEKGSLDSLKKGLEQSGADAEEQTLWRLEPEPLELPSRMAARKQQALDRMQELADQAEKAAADEAHPEAPRTTTSPPRSAL